MGDQVVLLQMETGPQKGQILEANSPNGLLFGTACKPGLEVITISSVVGQLHVTTVYNVDRSMPIYIFYSYFLDFTLYYWWEKRCKIGNCTYF